MADMHHMVHADGADGADAPSACTALTTRDGITAWWTSRARRPQAVLRLLTG